MAVVPDLGAKHRRTPNLFTQTYFHISSTHRVSVGGLCGALGALGTGAAASPAPSGAPPEVISQGLV